MSEFDDRQQHFYGQTDGTTAWPNSAEGDLLKIARAEIDSLRIGGITMHLPKEFYEKLKQYTMAIEHHEYGDTGYYRFMNTTSDNGRELLIFKLHGYGYHFDTYYVTPTDQFRVDKVRLYPNTMTVGVAMDARPDSGAAVVKVNRKEGIAMLTPSSRSSDTVVEELVKLTEEYINRSVDNHYVDYSFSIKWEQDHYQINLHHCAFDRLL